MEEEPGPPLSTFVIRFRRERGVEAPHWRGQARHIQSGEQVSFTDEAALIGFIRRWVAMPGERGAPRGMTAGDGNARGVAGPGSRRGSREGGCEDEP